MTTELCQPCKDLGFSILAHYKSIPKGASHDGKAHPAMCWDHKHGQVPRHIAEKMSPEQAKPKPLNIHNVDVSTRVLKPAPAPVQRESGPKTKKCICGCNEMFAPTSNRQVYALGHKPKPVRKIIRHGAEVIPPKPVEDRIITRDEVATGLELMNKGIKVAEIARRFGLPQNHVRYHLGRAIEGTSMADMRPSREVKIEQRHHTRVTVSETRAVGALGELEALREKLARDLEAVDTVIAIWNRA